MSIKIYCSNIFDPSKVHNITGGISKDPSRFNENTEGILKLPAVSEVNLSGLKLDPSNRINDTPLSLKHTEEQIAESKAWSKTHNYDKNGNLSSSNYYILNGTSFSEKEFKAVNEYADKVREALKYLAYDYSDYAKIGIAGNYVKSYVQKQGLSLEQQEAVVKDFFTYAEQHMSYCQPKGERLFFDESSNYWPHVKDDNGVVSFWTNTAVNSGLKNKILNIFSGIKVNNSASLQRALNEYNALMRSKYKLLSFNRNEWVDNRLKDDNNDFLKLAKDLNIAETYVLNKYNSIDINA